MSDFCSALMLAITRPVLPLAEATRITGASPGEILDFDRHFLNRIRASDDGTAELRLPVSELEHRLKEGEAAVIPALIAVHIALAELELNRGRLDAAATQLVALRDLSNRLGLDAWHFASLLLLTEIRTAQKDVPASIAYATALGEAFGRLKDTEEPVAHRGFFALLLAAAQQYHAEHFAGAARLFRRAIEIWPDNHRGHLWLGNTELKQDHPDAALASFERAIELDAHDARCHVGRCVALWFTRRHEDAIAAAGRAIEVAPSDSLGYLKRSHFRMSLGHFAEAIEDLKKAIDLSESSPVFEGHAPEDVTLTEYLSRMPAKDLAEQCRANLVRCYRSLGRSEEAKEQIDYLIEHGGPEVKQDAYTQLAELQRHDPASVIELYSKAINISEHPSDLRAQRAALYLEADDVKHALDDLDVIVRQRPSLEVARLVGSLVNGILHKNPNQVRALKIRAYMYHHTLAVNEAIQDLDRAVELAPTDADAHYWRALAKIASYHGGKTKAWGLIGPEKLIAQAVLDLAEAVRLCPKNENFLYALTWVVDHTSAHPRFLQWWTTLDVLPRMLPLLKQVLSARSLSGTGHWQSAVELLLVSQSQLEASGLQVFANSVNVDLADAYIGLYEFQKALDCLAAFDPALVRPLSPNFREAPGRPASSLLDGIATREEPYGAVQFLGVKYLVPQVITLHAAALHRLGDLGGALRMCEPLQDLIPRLTDYDEETRVLLMLKLAPVLRDAGATTQAMEMFDRVDHNKLAADLAFSVLIAKGLVLMRRGEFNEALIPFNAAGKCAEQLGEIDRRSSAVYLAMAYLELDQPKQALKRLKSHRPPSPTESLDEWLGYKQVLAQAKLATGDLEKATRILQEIVSELDRVRTRFRTPDFRMAWQARFEETYAKAILAHVQAGNAIMAFNLCERGRARGLMDQLEAGYLPVPASGQPLLDAVETLKLRIRLATEIESAVTAGGQHTMPYELVAELRRLDSEARIVERLEDGSEMILPFRVRRYREEQDHRIASVRAEIEDQRHREYEKIVGRSLSYPELREFLGKQEGERRIVLFEYFVLKEQTLLFIGRSDLNEPEIRVIPYSREEIEHLAQPTIENWTVRSCRLRGESSGGCAPAPDGLLAEFIAPAFDSNKNSKPAAERDDLLWIVPHGPLHYVPFHAIRVGGSPLIARNPICYSPSASAMLHCHQRFRPGLSGALVVGDPRGDLKQARFEALLVAGMFGAKPVIKDATGTRIRALISAERHDVLHFACHGQFDRTDPFQSALLVRADDGMPDLLTVRDLLQIQLNAQLVVLSACQTGLNEIRPGDELIGFTRALMAAGAAALVVSLWEVDDISTALLMLEFYRRLLADARSSTLFAKANALRAAQTYLLTASAGDLASACRERLHHLRSSHASKDLLIAVEEVLADLDSRDPADRPFAAYDYWAPFLLIGYWG